MVQGEYNFLNTEDKEVVVSYTKKSNFSHSRYFVSNWYPTQLKVPMHSQVENNSTKSSHFFQKKPNSLIQFISPLTSPRSSGNSIQSKLENSLKSTDSSPSIFSTLSQISNKKPDSAPLKQRARGKTEINSRTQTPPPKNMDKQHSPRVSRPRPSSFISFAKEFIASSDHSPRRRKTISTSKPLSMHVSFSVLENENVFFAPLFLGGSNNITPILITFS